MSGSGFDLTGSRLQNATRVNQANEDADVADWAKADDFIVCAMVEALGHGGTSGTLQLRWRNVTDSGSFIVLSGSGELTWSGTTDLANGNAVASGEEVCTPVGGSSLVDGVEREGANDVSTTLAQNEYAEHQWAIDASGGLDGKQYEFEIYDATAGAAVGTCLADITTLSLELQTGAYFDGANDWLGGVNTTSLTDNDTGLISFWFKPDSGGSGADVYFDITSRFFIRHINRGGAEEFQVVGGGGSEISLLTDNAAFNYDQWNHFLCSFDLSADIAHIYINDVEANDEGAEFINTSGIIDWTHTNSFVGSAGSAGSAITAALQVFYLTNEYLDISVEANRREFITADGEPNISGMGADGSGPTGTQPAYYLRDPYDSFETNYGSLGNFTVTGALTDDGTLPALPAAGGVVPAYMHHYKQMANN